MSRTPARFTQADLSRAIRAARQVGAPYVELRPDGSILVALNETYRGPETDKSLDQVPPIEL